MKLTMKKKVFQKIVQSLSFARFVKFFCYDSNRGLLLQAYEDNETEHILADVALTVQGELDYFSIGDDEQCFRYCRIEELLVELYKANDEKLDDASLITLEVKNLWANFRVHPPDGDDKYTFRMAFLYTEKALHFLYPLVDEAFCSFVATSIMSASTFSNYCTDYLKKGADSVYLAIPAPQTFQFFTKSVDGTKTDVVEMKVTTPCFNYGVFYPIKLKYLDYFIKIEAIASEAAKVEAVTSEAAKIVGISLGTKESVVRVEYDLAGTDYITFYLGPRPCNI